MALLVFLVKQFVLDFNSQIAKFWEHQANMRQAIFNLIIFLHVAFRAIFKICSYIVLKTDSIQGQQGTGTLYQVVIVLVQNLHYLKITVCHYLEIILIHLYFYDDSTNSCILIGKFYHQ